nr:nicotianamine synthase family protein [Kineosporia babensis]
MVLTEDAVSADAVSAGVSPDRLHAEQLARRVAEIYESLRQQPGLEPSTLVNRLFGELVGLCGEHGGDLSPRAVRVLEDERITSRLPGLHEVCAQGEYLMETHWSRRIAAADKPQDELEGFPYLDNYRELTRLEINLLRCFGVDPAGARRICFLGAGPLPLSAICLYAELAVPVDVVDHSAEAVALGSACADALLGPGPVRFHHAEAAEFEAVSESDVVVLGALAGLDPEAKNAILAALWERLRPGAVLLVRSAAGLRRLLYPAVGEQELSGWEQLGVLHPLNDVINSVIVLRRPARL